MTGHAAFAEELARSEDADHGFLFLLRHHRELDLAFLNVKHAVGGVALREHVLILLKFKDGLARAHIGKKDVRIESALDRLRHRDLPLPPAQYSQSPESAEGGAMIVNHALPASGMLPNIAQFPTLASLAGTASRSASCALPVDREVQSHTHLRAHETGRNLVCRLL